MGNNFKILGVVVLVVVLSVAGWFLVTKQLQNRETIVDLGNGWKSYHYNQTGITIKIPKDTTIKKEHADTRWAYSAIFSKGIVKSVGAIKMVALHSTHNHQLAHKKDIEELREKVKKGVVEKYTEFGMRNDKKISIKRTSKNRVCEGLFDNKVAFIKYTDDKFDGEKIYKLNKDITLIIPGYRRQHFVGIDIDQIHKQYPHLDKIPFKDRCEEYIKIIKPYILKIDNF